MDLIVDYLKSIGQPSDFATRTKMANSYGIANYQDTAEQNLNLLSILQGGEKPIDFQKNQQTIQKMGREPNPSDPNDVINFAKATYAPEEMPSVYQKMINDMSQKNAMLAGAPSNTSTYNPQQLQQMLSSGQLSQEDLAKLYPSIQAAGQSVTGEGGLISQATERKRLLPGALNTLQTALKMASDVGNQPTGESQIFQQLGLDSYETLMQSLRARNEEMGFKYESYSNLVKEIGTSMYADNQQKLDEAKLALDNYNSLRDDYKYETDRLDKISASAKDYENKLDFLDRQHRMSIEENAISQNLQYQRDLALEQEKARYKAQEGTGDSLTDWISGIGTTTQDFSQPELTSFDYNEKSLTMDSSFGSRVIEALNVASERMGKPINIDEAYRSPERSDELYAKYQAGEGGVASKGGESLHNYGRSVDLHSNYDKLKPEEIKILEDTMKEYGFDNPVKGDRGHWQLADQRKKLDKPLMEELYKLDDIFSSFTGKMSQDQRNKYAKDFKEGRKSVDQINDELASIFPEVLKERYNEAVTHLIGKLNAPEKSDDHITISQFFALLDNGTLGDFSGFDHFKALKESNKYPIEKVFDYQLQDEAKHILGEDFVLGIPDLLAWGDELAKGIWNLGAGIFNKETKKMEYKTHLSVGDYDYLKSKMTMLYPKDKYPISDDRMENLIEKYFYVL